MLPLALSTEYFFNFILNCFKQINIQFISEKILKGSETDSSRELLQIALAGILKLLDQNLSFNDAAAEPFLFHLYLLYY